MQLQQLLRVDFGGVGMAQQLNFLQRQEQHVVSAVDGARDAVDGVRDGYAST